MKAFAVKSAVIHEVDPSLEGWILLHGRTWQKPDGTLFEFPPGEREVLTVYQQMGDGQILDLTRKQ